MNEPRDHHYVPQFYLRNFASDSAKRKISTVAKNGHLAIWSQRSIERMGFERDLYVHTRKGVPVSVETRIGQDIETPISRSETWDKIMNGHAEALDASDKPVLYALFRHLEARTPHAFQTMMELAAASSDPENRMRFTDEERSLYARFLADPEWARAFFNMRSSSMEWAIGNYHCARIRVYRSPIPVKSSSTPVYTMGLPHHERLRLPLPGMVPYQLVLPLNPTTVATLVYADFEEGFRNIEIPVEVALGFNRNRVGTFAFFDAIRHLVTSRDQLIDDMTAVRPCRGH